GVKSSALVSLTSVIETDGSAPNCSSKCWAVVTPANPPPRITMRVFTPRDGGGGSYSGPSQKKARSLRICEIKPKLVPYQSQPIKAGKSVRIPSAVHWGALPHNNGNPMTLTTAHSGTPSAAVVIMLSTYACGVGAKASAYATPTRTPRSIPSTGFFKAAASRILLAKPHRRPMRPRRTYLFICSLVARLEQAEDGYKSRLRLARIARTNSSGTS